MKLEQSSYYVDKAVPLKTGINEFVKNQIYEEDAAATSKFVVNGGVLSDVRYSWLSNGPRLEILHTKSGTKIAAWTFGAVLRDFETCVSCVVDVPGLNGKLPLLVVGLECKITGGMVCMFDMNSSRVLRTIQIDEKVTSVHVVNMGADSSLPGALRALDGVLAVGTAKGHVFLIDLCRQMCEEAIISGHGENVRDEINACQLMHVTLHDLTHLERHKELSVHSGEHVCFQLNEWSTNGEHFTLRGPAGEERLHVNKEEVTVSALHYCPQLGALLVGYNFGAFQLFNLLALRLEYTSPVYEECLPVTHLAVQEPCDDPRAFCYLWVVYSATIGDARAEEPGYPMAAMYALAYNTKDFLEGYGHLYQELVSCSVRFQVELTPVPGSRLATNRISKTGSGRCISIRSYTHSITGNATVEEKLALCAIVWTVRDGSATDTFLGLFDLNQWYREQMPNVPSSENDPDSGAYMVCASLEDLFETPDPVLDVRLDSTSISAFVSAQRLEEHDRPAALAFRAVCVCSRYVFLLGSQGAQRHLLAQLERGGPLCLLRPTDLYQRCVALGLVPLFYEVPAVRALAGTRDLTGAGTVLPLRVQRELILGVALEQRLVHWLCACARTWADGSQAGAGCTLDLLLDWAWQRADTLKVHANRLCTPLFDYSGSRLDANTMTQLDQCACQLRSLVTLFDTVVHRCCTFLAPDDAEDVRYQWRALQMLSTYLEVLQWLLNVGLLPECPLSMYPRPDETERISAPYPAETLTRFYKERRAQLRQRSQENEHNSKLQNSTPDDQETCDTGCDLLFIDNLIKEECGGELLQRHWQCDAGGGSGLYPPPSLQALLRSYLLEDVDIVNKHCLVIYVFLDLAMTLDHSRYKPIITHLIKFPAVFKISPSVIKITQAFWQLDQGDFSTAMTQLLDPAVCAEDLKPWHHRTVQRALLLQGQHQHALLYHEIRKPPVTSVQDICVTISLLIASGMLQEAFYFQRQHRSPFNQKQLLKHFFHVCDSFNKLASILPLPLNEIEEVQFVKYLKANQTDKNKNFLVIYYLQRDRYAEAFETNEDFCKNEIMKQGLLGQRDRTFRNAIISGFKKTLPVIIQELLEYCHKDKNLIIKQIKRPVPMSVFVHDAKEQARYKSTLIEASFRKAKETWSHISKKQTTCLDDEPFISTPKIITADQEKNFTPVIYPAIVHTDEGLKSPGSEVGGTPAKRMKLSPRQSVSAAGNISTDRIRRRVSGYGSNSLLDTPIVKRKSYRTDSTCGNEPLEQFVVETPTSILKSRSFLRTSVSPETAAIDDTSTTPEVDDDIEFVPLDGSSSNVFHSTRLKINESDRQTRKSSLGVSPRRPIQRTPHPGVRFDNINRPQSHSSDGSVDNVQMEVRIEVHREQTPDKQSESGQGDSKNSSRSTTDVFYSPNESLSEAMEQDQENSIEVVPQEKEDTPHEENESEEQRERRQSLKRKATDSGTPVIQSRRSYKATPDKTPTPARETRDTRTRTTPLQTKGTAAKKPEVFPKLSGRRSLSRHVLEQNTIAQALAAPRIQTRISLAHLLPSDTTGKNQTTGIEVSYSKSTTFMKKASSNNLTEESCDKSTMERKNVFSTERDPDTSAQIIKHVHNESSEKSSVKKVTEILDQEPTASQEEMEESYHVLSPGSHFDESVVSKMFNLQYQYPEEAGSLSSTRIESDNLKGNVEYPQVGSIQEKNNEENNMIDDSSKNMVETNESVLPKGRSFLSATVFEDISSISVDTFSEMQTEDYSALDECSKIVENEDSVTDKNAPGDSSVQVTADEDVNYVKVSQKSAENDEKLQSSVQTTSSRKEAVDESAENEERQTLESAPVEVEIADENKSTVDIQEEGRGDFMAVEEVIEVDASDADIDEENHEDEHGEEDEEQEDETEQEEAEMEQEEEAEQEEEENLETSNSAEDNEDSESESSRSSDVIEIKSSSEESLEELKISYHESARVLETEGDNELEIGISDVLDVEVDTLDKNIESSKESESSAENIPEESRENSNMQEETPADEEPATCGMVTEEVEIDFLEENVFSAASAEEKPLPDENVQEAPAVQDEHSSAGQEKQMEIVEEKVATTNDEEHAVSDMVMEEVEIDPLEENVFSAASAEEKSLPGGNIQEAPGVQDEHLPDTSSAEQEKQMEIVEEKVAATNEEESVPPPKKSTRATVGLRRSSRQSVSEDGAQETHMDHTIASKSAPQKSTRRRNASVDTEKPTESEEPEVLRRSTRAAKRNTRSSSSSDVLSVDDIPIARRTRAASVDSQTSAPGDTFQKSSRNRRGTSIESESSAAVDASQKPAPVSSRTRRGASLDTENPVEKSASVPGRRRKSASLEPQEIAVSTRTRRGSSVEPQVSGDPKAPEDDDDVTSQPISSRTQRSTSEEPQDPGEILTRSAKRKRQQSTHLEAIAEELKPEADPDSVQDDDMNPIVLIESFSDTLDPEEKYLRSTSPASSVDTQASTAMPSTPRRTRSQARGILTPSTTPTKEQAGASEEATLAPKSVGRPRRKSFTAAKQALVTPTKRTSRRGSHDTDSSDVSSVVSVPGVLSEPVTEAYNLRHRSLSPTILQKETASPRIRRRSSKMSGSALRTDLSKIPEESTSSQEKNAKELETVVEGRPKRARKTEESNKRQTNQQQIEESRRNSASIIYLKYPTMKSRRSFKWR